MDTTDTLIQQLERPLDNPLTTPVVYRIKAGDTLSQIITRYYGIRYNDARYKTALASVLYFNETVTDPNEIKAGQLLRLMPLYEDNATAFCPAPDDFHQQPRSTVATRHRLEPLRKDYKDRFNHHLPLSKDEYDAFWALAWLEENYEYDYRRQLALKKYSQKIGPFEKLLFKGQTAREAVRISHTKALPATVKIDNQLHRLGKMAKYAKHGGIILTAASVGMACHDIGHAQTRQEKNEIFVETFGSTMASAGASIALGLYFIATPAGWVTALALGTAAAVGSYGAGKGLKSFYNKFGNKVDIVSGLGIDKLC